MRAYIRTVERLEVERVWLKPQKFNLCHRDKVLFLSELGTKTMTGYICLISDFH